MACSSKSLKMKESIYKWIVWLNLTVMFYDIMKSMFCIVYRHDIDISLSALFGSLK